MTTLSLHTFGRGGIHAPSHKEATAGRPIERIPTPHEVWLPLHQSLGEPATPIVKKGEVVLRGQKIAEGGTTGVPIHATITGKVKPLDKRPHPTQVLAPAIVIARAAVEGPDEIEFPEDPSWRTLSREEMLDRIREAGIVGLGGAAFPTWRKLMLPPSVSVDTLVINGAECEPYLTSDHRLMIARARDIVDGALLMARLLGVKRVKVGIEEDKVDARWWLETEASTSTVDGATLEVVPCEVRYPQGAEKQLVAAITGRFVPPRALPTAVGVVVQNVATAAAVYEAIRYRKPLLDRVLTVTGPGIVEPRNLQVPIGTLIGDIVAFCGGLTPDVTRLIAGGPMMGRALPRLDIPLIKGMNGLVALTGRGPFEDGFGPCIRCGRCLDACPLGLEPDQVGVRVEAGRPLETEEFGALDCYECGSCTFVCPAGRPLVQFIQIAKSALRRSAALRVTA